MTKNDPNRKISARAVATVVVSFPVSGGGWSDDAQLAQVFDQARESAEVQARKLFRPDDGVQIQSIEIKAVLTELSK